MLEARVPGADHAVTKHPKDACDAAAQMVKIADGEAMSTSALAYEKGQSVVQEAQTRGHDLAQACLSQAQQ